MSAIMKLKGYKGKGFSITKAEIGVGTGNITEMTKDNLGYRIYGWKVQYEQQQD